MINNFLNYIKNNKSKIFPLLVIGFIALIIPLTLILIKKPQDIRKKASANEPLIFSSTTFYPQEPGLSASFDINLGLDPISGVTSKAIYASGIELKYDPSIIEINDINCNPDPANLPTQVKKNIDVVLGKAILTCSKKGEDSHLPLIFSSQKTNIIFGTVNYKIKNSLPYGINSAEIQFLNVMTPDISTLSNLSTVPNSLIIPIITPPVTITPSPTPALSITPTPIIPSATPTIEQNDGEKPNLSETSGTSFVNLNTSYATDCNFANRTMINLPITRIKRIEVYLKWTAGNSFSYVSFVLRKEGVSTRIIDNITLRLPANSAGNTIAGEKWFPLDLSSSPVSINEIGLYGLYLKKSGTAEIQWKTKNCTISNPVRNYKIWFAQ